MGGCVWVWLHIYLMIISNMPIMSVNDNFENVYNMSIR